MPVSNKSAISFVKYISLLLFWCGTVLPISVYAQKAKRQQLDQEKKSLYKEVATAQKLLQATQRNKAASTEGLLILQRQIAGRENIIANIEEYITLLDISITDATQKIDSLDHTLKILKQEYVDMVRQAYLTESTYNRLLFLFSAKDVNDAYKRIKYMEYYRNHRKKQLDLIGTSQRLLISKLATFKSEKNEQSLLLGDAVNERGLLEKEKNVKSTMVKQLRGTEKQLKQKISQQQTALEDLNDQIRDLIRAETPAPKSTSTTHDTNKATPKTGKLSVAFAQNKGKLPWPVAEGIITEHFGTNPHPLLPNIEINNNGINIATPEGSSVDAIFQGTVSNILYNPSFQWAIIINHGEYYTVYAHLGVVDVAKGDEITTKQSIGTVYTDLDENKTTVHLEIWDGNTKLNPARWLATK